MATPRISPPALEGEAPSPAALRRRAEEEARRAFLRAASHELRTPLNAIIGFSEIIVRELHGPVGDPRYVGHAEIVRDCGVEMLALVNDMLEIARLEGGVADLQPLTERLDPLLAGAAGQVVREAAERGVRLERDVPEDLCAFACGRTLSAAVTRLLKSAVACSPEGATVRLAAASTGKTIRIEVQDEGPGVSPKDVQRLLRPLLDDEQKGPRRTKSGGLGFAVANLQIRAMGGRLRLQSAGETGMTAVIHLPACSA